MRKVLVPFQIYKQGAFSRMDPGSPKIMLCLTGSELNASREGSVCVCIKPKAECFILIFFPLIHSVGSLVDVGIVRNDR